MRFDPTKAPVEGGARFPRLSLKKDEVARIAILTTQDWEMSVRHFVQKMGYIHCLAIHKAKDELDFLKIEEEGGRPDECPLCKAAIESASEKEPLVSRPQRRVAIKVLRYKTDMRGQIMAGTRLQYWMEIWIISNDKYRQLRNIMDEWKSIREHDLSLTCDEPQYQKLIIDVKKEALWIQEKNEVAAFWKAETQKYVLMDCLGQTLSVEQIKGKLDAVNRRFRVEAPVSFDEPEKEPEVEDIAAPGKAGGTSDDFFGQPTNEVVKPEKTTAPPESDKDVDFLKELNLEDV